MNNIFIDYQTSTFKWYMPFVNLYHAVWFFIPRYIEKKTFYSREYSTDPIPSFFGMICRRDECACFYNKWWKNIEYVG